MSSFDALTNEKKSRFVLLNIFSVIKDKLIYLENRETKLINLINETKKSVNEANQLSTVLENLIYAKINNINNQSNTNKKLSSVSSRNNFNTNKSISKLPNKTNITANTNIPSKSTFNRNKTPAKQITTNNKALNKDKSIGKSLNNTVINKSTSKLNTTINTARNSKVANTSIKPSNKDLNKTTNLIKTSSNVNKPIDIKARSINTNKLSDKSNKKITKNSSIKEALLVKNNNKAINTSTNNKNKTLNNTNNLIKRDKSINKLNSSNSQKLVNNSTTKNKKSSSNVNYNTISNLKDIKTSNTPNGGSLSNHASKIRDVSPKNKQNNNVEKSEKEVMSKTNQNDAFVKIETKIENIETKRENQLNNTKHNNSINVSNIIGTVDNSILENELLTNTTQKDEVIGNSTFVKIEEINECNNTNNNIKQESNNTTKENEDNKKDYSKIFYNNFNVIASFYSTKELVKKLSVNKMSFKLSLLYLAKESDSLLSIYNKNLNDCNNKFNEKDLAKELEPFKLNRGSDKAITLLNDSIYRSLYDKNIVPVDDILLPYKIFLQLISGYVKDISPINCFLDSTIWRYFCELIEKEAENAIGSYMNSLLIKYFDDSPENLIEVYNILKPNIHKITPNYYTKLCGATGLLVFFVKDSLDYLGLLIDKKTNPKRAIKTYKDIIAYLEEVKNNCINKTNSIQI